MLAELVNGLIRRGHDVKIVMPVIGEVEYDVSAQIIRLNKSTLEAADYPASDILVSNYYTIVEEVEKASRQGKGKHVRISLCYEPALMGDNAATFTSYHHTPNLIVLSQWQKDLIRLAHGIEGSIIPVGVSTDFHNTGMRDSIKHTLNIGAIMRRLTPENWHRQQDYLISVMEQIKNKYPRVNVHFITPPNEFKTSPPLIRYSSQKPFQFHLPQNDQELNTIYNYLHIFVNSSIYDTASIPSLEAMKCGAALVTTYNGGNADYTVNGQNSLVSFRYQNRLQEDIETLIQKSVLRKQLALNGEKEAAKWTWERSVTAFEACLLKVLNQTIK